MATYATVEALRADPAIGDADPPTDATLEARLVDAEDLIDRVIGPHGIDEATGRALIPGDLDDWRTAKIARATIILARTAITTPGAFDPPAGGTIEGPVFKVSNITGGMSPAGTTALRAAVALLDQAGVRRLTARARA